MRKRFHAVCRGLFLLLTLAVLSSCTSGRTASSLQNLQSGAGAGPTGIALPAPSGLAARLAPLPRSASFEMEDLVVAGEDFSIDFPFNRVVAGADAATFSPNWFPGTPGIDGLAYAIYSLTIPSYTGSAKLHYFWKTTPTNPERAFIALANFDRNSWDWKPGNAAGSLEYASFDPYFVAGGNMLVCVVLTGEAIGELDSIRIGSLPPEVSLSSDIRGGILPFRTTLSAESTDPDNAIVEYLWDPEGDGSFDVSTGTAPELEHEYATAGTFDATVKVVDAEGIFTLASQSIRAYNPGPFTVGGDQPDRCRTCLMAPDGRLLLVGTSQVASKDDLLYCSISPDGVVDFARAWGESNTESASTAMLSSDGFVYLTASDFTHAVVLLQKWDTQGNLIWSKGLGSTGNAVATGLADLGGGRVAVCGDLVSTNGQQAIAAFDADGGLLWARGVGDAGKTCFLADCAAFQPDAGPLELRCCGTVINDSRDLLYLTFNADGDFQTVQTYGDITIEETSRALASTPDGTPWILGSFEFGSTFALLARVGGTVTYMAGTDSSEDIFIGDLVAQDGLLQVLLTVNSESGLFGVFNTAQSLQSMQSFTSDGFINFTGLQPCGPGGLVCAGAVSGVTPAVASYEPTVDQFISDTWGSTAPPITSITIPVVDIDLEARDFNGLQINSGLGDGDACIVLQKLEN